MIACSMNFPFGYPYPMLVSCIQEGRPDLISYWLELEDHYTQRPWWGVDEFGLAAGSYRFEQPSLAGSTSMALLVFYFSASSFS